MMYACVFCRVSLKNGEEITQLREKGCNTVNRTSQTRNNTIVTTPGQKVHQKCRRDYINANSIKNYMREKDVSITEPTRDLRSSTPDFEFQKNCLFCGYFAKFSECKRGIDVFPVRTTDFSNTLRNICKKRNDEWSEIVLRRLNIAPSDLHAADAIYHQTCSVNFRTGQQIPVSKQANKMVEKGIKTKHADADADVLIALTAIESAKTKPTVLLGEDTDLLVLLLHHADVTSNSLIFKSGNVSKVNTHIKIWDILKTKVLLGEELCTLLPLIHAISGCDTTSRMFGVSKAATLKKFAEHDFLKTRQLLCNANAKDDVISAGENIISSLYNGAPYEELNVLRYRKFAARVLTNKTCVQIHTLPPTSNAASFHSQRAYLQMKMWMNEDNLNPCEWGWKVANGNLVPVKCTVKLPLNC